MKRYEALPAEVRRDMESRFMWAATTGAHPDATVEGAVAAIVEPLLDLHRGAVSDAIPGARAPETRRRWVHDDGTPRMEPAWCRRRHIETADPDQPGRCSDE